MLQVCNAFSGESKQYACLYNQKITATDPILFLVSFVIFFLVRLLPGDIIDAIQAQSYDIEVDRAAPEEALGLGVSITTQYGRLLII